MAKKTETIAVLSQKGGTGKTTTVRTLTDALRRSGVRTLAIDLDPQGNLSDYFDVAPDAEPTIADVLSGRASTAEACERHCALSRNHGNAQLPASSPAASAIRWLFADEPRLSKAARYS